MWIAGFGACSNDPKNELDTSTWAGMNKDKLDYDCRQVIACNEMNMNDAVGDYDDCVHANAQKLNANTTGQAVFLTKYFRCNQHPGCDYTRCVGMDPVMSYGKDHITTLNYVCQAKSDCGTEMGHPVDDPTTAVANCAAMYVGTVDTWQLDQRNAFEAQFNSCGTLASCQFLACFPY
jgi:hypothetical protein